METITTNSTSDPIEFVGGVGTAVARGTFGGGTLTMEYCPSFGSVGTAGDWVAVSGVSFTAAGQQNITIGSGHVRFVLTGATSPSIRVDVLGAMGRASNW